jgi:hypothetical protein
MASGEAWRDRDVATRFASERAATVPAIHHLPHDRKRAFYGEILEAITAFWSAARPSEDVEAIRTRYHTRPDPADNIQAPVERQCAWLCETGFLDVDVCWEWFEPALFGGRTPCS